MKGREQAGRYSGYPLSAGLPLMVASMWPARCVSAFHAAAHEAII
jgi:hypothetical protein